MSEEKKARKLVAKKGVTKTVVLPPMATPGEMRAAPEAKAGPAIKAVAKAALKVKAKITAKARAKSLPASIEDIIRLRAYEIYLQRGARPGNPHEDWQVAEREVRAFFEQTGGGHEADA